MKNLLFIISLIAALSASAQNVTVTAPLTPEQKAALKYLLNVSIADTNSPFFGLTNMTVSQFATNYAVLQVSDVVSEAFRNRRNAIAGQLVSASDDTLTAIEAVLRWSNATDLTKNQVVGVTNNVRLLPLAAVDSLTASGFALGWTNGTLTAIKMQQITNAVFLMQNASASKLTNAVAALQ